MRKIFTIFLLFLALSPKSFAGEWVRSHIYVDGEVLTAENLNTSINEGVNAVNDITGANLDAAIAINSSGTMIFSGNFTASGNNILLGNDSNAFITIKAPQGIEYSDAATWTFAHPQTVSGTWANLGTVTTIDINGGTVDGTVIGGSSPSTGKFTTLLATGNVGIDSTNPGQALDVQGTIRTTGFALTSGVTSGYLLQTDAHGNGAWVNAYHTSQTFTSSGTYTASASTSIVFVSMCGGGGAGGVATNGGGGGAGGWIIDMPYVVTPGNSYTVTINGAHATTVFDALIAPAGVSASGSTGGAGGGGLNGLTTGVVGNYFNAGGSGGNGGGNGGSGGSTPFGLGGGQSSPGLSGTGYCSGGGGSNNSGGATAGQSGIVIVGS